MKVLAIVGSGKRMGNSEILAKHMLAICRNQGAKVRLLRLADWHLEECQGCFSCLFKSKACHINDDMQQFAKLVQSYDRLIVCAPTYLLLPPGIVKIIIDRIGLFIRQALKQKSHTRYAAIVAVAGLKGWDCFTLPVLNMFLRVISGYQADIVGRAIAYHPMPAEVLLSDETLAEVESLAVALIEGVHVSTRATRETQAVLCPVCGSTSFALMPSDPGSVSCSFCTVKGRVGSNGNVHWDKSSLRQHRFTEDAGRAFVENWILRTEGMFKERFREIALQKREYKDNQMDIRWELPNG